MAVIVGQMSILKNEVDRRFLISEILYDHITGFGVIKYLNTLTLRAISTKLENIGVLFLFILSITNQRERIIWECNGI